MIVLLSPAKTLDFEQQVPAWDYSEPAFRKEAASLIDVLKKKSVSDIRSLMKLSESLAQLNTERYRHWQPSPDDNATRPALLAFRGDVYQGLEADSLDKRDVNFAQKHLRILSGLYGLLRPLDRMQPYRLEMGTRLSNARGENLYDFWRAKITQSLNKEILQHSPKAIINLASNEYFDAVDVDAIDARILAPRFLDYSRDDYRIVSFFAKRARGAMAGWIIRERVRTLKALTTFDGLGYRYSAQHSTDGEPTFIRDKQ